MKHTNMGKDVCPSCGTELNRATSMGEHTPNPGDLSICVHCTAWLRYSSDMALEKLTKIDVQSMNTEVLMELHRMTNAIKKAKDDYIRHKDQKKSSEEE